MKTLHTILFLVSVSVGFAATGISVPVPAQASDDALLSAIAAVETGNNPRRLGHYGERTQLQILPQTWRHYSTLPHAQAAANPAETERVAKAYLATIRERIKERGLPETPFFIAAAWNAGPSWKRLSPGTISYAERVANIVESREPAVASNSAPAEPKQVVATVVSAPVAPAMIQLQVKATPAPVAPPPTPASAILASFSNPVPVISLGDSVTAPKTVVAARTTPIALFQISGRY